MIDAQDKPMRRCCSNRGAWAWSAALAILLCGVTAAAQPADDPTAVHTAAAGVDLPPRPEGPERWALGHQVALTAAAGLVTSAVDSGWRFSRAGVFSSHRGELVRPVRGRVLEPFGPVRVDGLFTTVRHPGVTYSLRPGTEVHAVAAGIVRHTSELNGYGQVVIIDHGHDFHTVYALLSEVVPELGDVVEANDVIGRTGDADPYDGNRLYFEIRQRGEAVDPADWIGFSR